MGFVEHSLHFEYAHTIEGCAFEGLPLPNEPHSPSAAIEGDQLCKDVTPELGLVAVEGKKKRKNGHVAIDFLKRQTRNEGSSEDLSNMLSKATKQTASKEVL